MTESTAPLALRLEVLRLDPDLPLPRYARAGDAGLDLRSAESVTIAPGDRALVRTGIAVAIPEGFAGFVLPRSGLAVKHGLSMVNTPGLIDAGYRGEIQLALINHDRTSSVTITRGERVAQLVIQAIARVEIVEVTTLPASERGAGGFGSTG